MRSTLPRGSAQWNSCHALPHCSGAVGRGYWAHALHEFHCPPPPSGVAVHCKNCTAHFPQAVRQCVARIALPTAPGRCGSALQELHVPLPPGSQAVYCSWGDGESCPGSGRCPKSGPPAMHCHTAWAHWAVELLQRTASLPGGSGHWNSCKALLTAWGPLPTATLPRGSGHWNSCHALPHCLGSVAVQFLQYTATLPGGGCLGAVGSGTPATDGLTAWGQWAVESLQCTASLPGGSGQWNSCNALPHCLGAVGSHALPHCLGQWVVQFMPYTASLHGCRAQCYSCYAVPHYLGAVGSATPAMQCLTA